MYKHEYIAITGDAMPDDTHIHVYISHRDINLIVAQGKIWVNICSGNGSLPDKNKPLPEPK